MAACRRLGVGDASEHAPATLPARNLGNTAQEALVMDFKKQFLDNTRSAVRGISQIVRVSLDSYVWPVSPRSGHKGSGGSDRPALERLRKGTR